MTSNQRTAIFRILADYGQHVRDADAAERDPVANPFIGRIMALSARAEGAVPEGWDELLRAANNYIRCSTHPDYSPFIKENGRYGTKSPWVELCEAAALLSASPPPPEQGWRPTHEAAVGAVFTAMNNEAAKDRKDSFAELDPEVQRLIGLCADAVLAIPSPNGDVK